MSDVLSAGLLAGVGGLYLTGEDHLRLTTWGALASAVVTLEARLIDRDGCLVPIVATHTPTSDRTSATTIVPLAAGVLTGAQLRVTSGAAVRGHIYAILEVIRGLGATVQPLQTLLGDYVVSNGRLAWPGSPIRSSIEGPGRLRSITGTDPAAGAEISEAVPTGARWRVLSVRASLATSAVVANRQADLTLDDGANVFATLPTPGNLTASNTWRVSWFPGAVKDATLAEGTSSPLPTDTRVAAGARLRTATTNLDAGDNWSAPQYLVEEWIEP